MEAKIVVVGGSQLEGRVVVSGAKNAVLPIITATLLTDAPCRLLDIPRLADVETICEVLVGLGTEVDWSGHDLTLHCREVNAIEAPYQLVRQMRASFLVLGPLLAREGKAKMTLPGGCAIGLRPIDLHLKGLAAMGAEIEVGHGTIAAQARQLVGARIYLDYPSVGATEHLMMAASLARGLTIIENAAEEPEIVDLANYINGMGGRISGAGTKVVRIEGVQRLHGTKHTIIPDRIEAGTFMVAAAAAGGNVLIENVIVDHLKPVVAKLREAGVGIWEEQDGVRVVSDGQIAAIDVKTLPYPGFPTDMQAQMMAMLTVAGGTSVITESVFENRFMHAQELKRMGADINLEGHTAVVRGVQWLAGASVKATDLRAGAALIIAGLQAKGVTEVGCIHHIQRGYEDIVSKLQHLGADIELKTI